MLIIPQDNLIVATFRHLLAEAGPRQAEVMRACAVPRWFDLAVVELLRGRADGNERVLELLRGYSFVRPLGTGRFAYSAEVRKLSSRGSGASMASSRKTRPGRGVITTTRCDR